MKELWSTVEMKAQEWGPVLGAKAQEFGSIAGTKAQEWGAVAGEKAQIWGTTAADSVKGFSKKMSCKKCVVKDFFKRDWTTTEKVLFAVCLFLLGVVIGFLLAPIKKGISCGNNNGNTYNNDDDWSFDDEI